MFIELAEILKCPSSHAEAYCVVAPEEMVGRQIVRGTVGCPICKQDYPIEDGVLRMGAADEALAAPASAEVDAQMLQALLGLATPGGYVVLIGAAAAWAPDLVSYIGGVHFIAVNPPPSLEPAPAISIVTARDAVPLRAAVARGVVVGPAGASGVWLDEAARVLVPSLRMVALATPPRTPRTIHRVAEGRGAWVGQKAPPDRSQS